MKTRSVTAIILMSLVLVTASVSFAGEPIKVLIVDGMNNHNWEKTTEGTKEILEQTGRFTVDVCTSPSKRGDKKAWQDWNPKFSDYQVVLSNFNDGCEDEDGCETLWSSKTQAAFEEFVKKGGGFVPVHAADNAFPSWEAYNKMIGIGGWGGRQAGKSGYLLRRIDGKWQRTSPDKGLSGEHGPSRDYKIIHDKPSHPILKGMPTEWIHAKDEMYSALRGPAKNVEVLAYARSRVTKENEPMYAILTFGKGKIFHVAPGHYHEDARKPNEALHCVGFQTLLARGTEYVATGEVTIGIPDSFPSKKKTVVMAPDKVKWPK